MDPGRSLSNLTSCDPTTPKLFPTDTHLTVENTLGSQSPLAMGCEAVWGRLFQHKAQGKLTVRTALICASGMDLGSLSDDFYLPRQISPWLIQVFCSRR